MKWPVAALVLFFLSASLGAQVHANGPMFAVFPQGGDAGVFRATQTCSPDGIITASSIAIKMGACSPEFADVNARGQQFYVDSVFWNAVFNGTNTAPTTSNPPNEMVGFLTDDIVNFNKHEVGIICKLDQGLFVGYYQDHTVGGACFQTTGSLGSCVGSSTLTGHNFSVAISYDGTTNTFVYAVDSTTWTLKYESSTNYSRLLFWWWMTVHRNGSWNVPNGTETVYNSVSVVQDLLPSSPAPVLPPLRQSVAGKTQPVQQSTSAPVIYHSSFSLMGLAVFALSLILATPLLLTIRFQKKHRRKT